MKTKKKKNRRKNGPPRANWIWFFFPLPALWGKVNHPVFSEHLQFVRPYVLWGWALLKAVVTTQDGGSTLLPQYFWITSGHIYEYPLCHVTARCVPPFTEKWSPGRYSVLFFNYAYSSPGTQEDTLGWRLFESSHKEIICIYQESSFEIGIVCIPTSLPFQAFFF